MIFIQSQSITTNAKILIPTVAFNDLLSCCIVNRDREDRERDSSQLTALTVLASAE